MKKLLFTIVFLSVISFVGISKVSALPIGGVFDNWDSNKKQAGYFYSDRGATMPFFGYNGSGSSMSCPYLDNLNELSPLGCYFEMNTKSIARPSLLVNSYPLCTTGDCTTSGSIVNLTFLLYEDIYSDELFHFEQGEKYHIELYFGIKTDYVTTFLNFIRSGNGYQADDSRVSNLSSGCYLYNDSENPIGRTYCTIQYDYVPNRDDWTVFINFASSIPITELNYNLEWMLYPSVTKDPLEDLQKYTMKSEQYAFISGISSGVVMFPESYWLSNGSYLNYYDINRDTQPYSSYITDVNFTDDFEYMYYDFNLSDYSGAELVMLSTNSWSTSNYPFNTIDFYVPKNAYVDIVNFNPISNIGNTLIFKYKNPYTSLVQDVVVNSYSLDSKSGTLFANIMNGFDLFRQPILSIGSIFSEFFNNINSPLGWFFIILFSFGVLSIMLALFM